MHLTDYITSTIVFYRTRFYQMQPRNNQKGVSSVGKYVNRNRETAKIGFCTSLKSVNYFRFVPETIAFETITFLSGMQNLVKIGKELRT